ncbi:putative O-methyltransferase YrrM [Lewinella aquimaris]|uniref:Putative O-methyltransferase YrrM n=1 Tax=Neolewinella aquimaris TaxID=1835722 RepID=A0A840E5X6_9BACT|nr:class I SAM-dependent methyltransferase [Neolewinella aquimaris]MBB4079363.1 putative O-methyltransferase YrrM [Neolewinella aquimaris]
MPRLLKAVQLETLKRGFTMPSDLQVGSLLRTLVASRPGGRFLELGTGLGLSLSWITEGMDPAASVISIENEQDYASFATELFADNEGVTILYTDGGRWLEQYTGPPFDLIFADTWPGKYNHLNEALALVKPGGFYVIDDMLPQPNWPEGHAERAKNLLHTLTSHDQFYVTNLAWSTGVVIAVKQSTAGFKSPWSSSGRDETE